MLKLAAIVPTTPFLIEDISPDQHQHLEATLTGLHKLSVTMEKNLINNIVIIGHHSQLQPDKFSLCYAPTYQTNFEKFGDYSFKDSYNIDHEIINAAADISQVPTELKEQALLDHIMAVPLYHLANNNMTLAPIGYSELPIKDHYIFGQALGQIINQFPKNTAVLAATNLAGSAKSKYEKTILSTLEKNSIKTLLRLENKKLDEVSYVAARDIAILLGILETKTYKFKSLAYENPFGISYLTAELKFK